MERDRNDAEMEPGARPVVVLQRPARVAMFAHVLLAGIIVAAAACVPASEPAARASLTQAALLAFASTGELPAGADLRQSVAVVEPSQVGLDPQRLARVDSLIRAAIVDSVTPGAALAIGRRGRLIRMQGYGHLDWADGSPPVTDSSLYDLASLTKIVGTTTALMILTERGSVDLDAPVSRYLPWWRGGGKGPVTIRQLLLHRAGLPPFRPFWRELRGRDDYARGIAALRVVYPPGDSTVYSDIGFMALGFVVEAVTGDPLDTFLRRTVLEPLGMRDTGFTPGPAILQRVAPTEVDTVFRGIHVHGVVHDENAYALGGVAGHAGLFSSARDMAVFAQVILNGGSVAACPGDGQPCDGVRAGGARAARIVAPGTIARFTARHDARSSRALGWETPSPGSSAGDRLSERAFGHTGFTGTSIWIDPEKDVFVILLTNRVHPTRKNEAIAKVRPAVHDAVLEALGVAPK